MQAWMMIAGLIVAGVGQYLNSKPQYNSTLVKIGMALLGPLLYLMVEQPTGAPGGPAFMEWLDRAWVWALALPGLASLIGLAPGMATRTAALILGLGIMVWPSPTMAQTAPTNLAKVVQYGLSANAAWFEEPIAGQPTEFEGGANLALSLSPHIGAVGGFYRQFRAGFWRSSAGGRITATDVENKDFSIHVGIQYHTSTDPDRVKEWAPDVTIGVRPMPAEFPWFIVTVQGSRGLKSKQAWGIIGVRAKLPSF